MDDFWMLPNGKYAHTLDFVTFLLKYIKGQAVPDGSLSNALTPFFWSYNHWSPIDTANVGCQDQNHLPLMQTSLENDTTSDSLSTSVMDIHVSDNGSTTVTTFAALPQTDISLLNDAEVTDNKYHWLTDSIAFIRCNPFYALECALKEQYLVLKIENVSPLEFPFVHKLTSIIDSMGCVN
jgi:hypothetical protein